MTRSVEFGSYGAMVDRYSRRAEETIRYTADGGLTRPPADDDAATIRSAGFGPNGVGGSTRRIRHRSAGQLHAGFARLLRGTVDRHRDALKPFLGVVTPL